MYIQGLNKSCISSAMAQNLHFSIFILNTTSAFNTHFPIFVHFTKVPNLIKTSEIIERNKNQRVQQTYIEIHVQSVPTRLENQTILSFVRHLFKP